MGYEKDSLERYVQRQAKAVGYSLVPVPRRPDRYGLVAINGMLVMTGTLGGLASWLDGRGFARESVAR